MSRLSSATEACFCNASCCGSLSCCAEWRYYCTGWTFSAAAHLVINLGLIAGRLPVSVLPAAERQTWEVRLSKLVLAQGDWLPSCLDSGELCTLILVISLYESTITKLLNPECVSRVRLCAGEKNLALGLELFSSRWVEKLSHHDLTKPLMA